MEWKDISITVPKAQAEVAEAIATGIAGGGIYIEDYSDLEQQVEAIAHVDLIEQELRDKDRNTVIVHLYLSPSFSATSARSSRSPAPVPSTISSPEISPSRFTRATSPHLPPRFSRRGTC